MTRKDNKIVFTSPKLKKPLLKRKVMQTVRSNTWMNGFMKIRSQRIFHQDKFLYPARLLEVKDTRIGLLTERDAFLGCFNSLAELRIEMRKYFRFVKDFERHPVRKIRFKPKNKTKENREKIHYN